MWQLDSKTEQVPSLYPGRGTLTNKRVPKPDSKEATTDNTKMISAHLSLRKSGYKRQREEENFEQAISW